MGVLWTAHLTTIKNICVKFLGSIYVGSVLHQKCHKSTPSLIHDDLWFLVFSLKRYALVFRQSVNDGNPSKANFQLNFLQLHGFFHCSLSFPILKHPKCIPFLKLIPDSILSLYYLLFQGIKQFKMLLRWLYFSGLSRSTNISYTVWYTTADNKNSYFFRT